MNSEKHQFVRDRITELRERKGVSEYRMSLELGKSKGYLHNIISGRALPSMAEFFIICDYLGVSPKGFFDTEAEYNPLVHKITLKSRGLNEKSVNAVLGILDVIKDND